MKSTEKSEDIKKMFKHAKSAVGQYCKVYVSNLRSNHKTSFSYGTETYCYGIIKKVKLVTRNGLADSIVYTVKPVDEKIPSHKIKKNISKNIEFTKKPVLFERACVKLTTPIDYEIINELASRSFDEEVRLKGF